MAAVLIVGCSAAPVGSTSQTASPSASSAPAIPSSTSGPTSTTFPAAAAPAGAVQVHLAGPPGHFEPAALTVTAGDVAFYLDNISPGVHSMAIGRALHDSLAESANVLNGRAAVFTVSGLQAGQYVFWCTVSNHAAEGMVGTLIAR